MGASEWHSRVAYQPNIEAALQEARWQAFRAGDFYRSPDELPHAKTMTEDEFVAWCVEDLGPRADSEESRFMWRSARSEPSDPDALLASQPYSGTHSVIDMTGVAEKPDYNVVAPVADAVLDDTFGTRTPSSEEVAKTLEEWQLPLYKTWHGTYLIGYQGETPETIFFVGASGD